MLSNPIQYYSWGELYCKDLVLFFFKINVPGIEKQQYEEWLKRTGVGVELLKFID